MQHKHLFTDNKLKILSIRNKISHLNQTLSLDKIIGSHSIS